MKLNWPYVFIWWSTVHFPHCKAIIYRLYLLINLGIRLESHRLNDSHQKLDSNVSGPNDILGYIWWFLVHFPRCKVIIYRLYLLINLGIRLESHRLNDSHQKLDSNVSGPSSNFYPWMYLMIPGPFAHFS